MAITSPVWIVQPRINGFPGILSGVGAPGSEVYDKSTLYVRSDAVGLYQSDGAGVWTQMSATDAELSALAGLTSAADKVPYFTGVGTAAVADFSSLGRSLVAASSNAAQQTALGITAAAQSILDDTTVADVRTTLGLGAADSPAFTMVTAYLNGPSGSTERLAATCPFLSAEQTGSGAQQDVAHGFGVAPALAFAIPSDLTGGVYAVSYGAHDGANVKVTVTTGEKYRIVAFRGVP